MYNVGIVFYPHTFYSSFIHESILQLGDKFLEGEFLYKILNFYQSFKYTINVNNLFSYSALATID